MPRLLKSSAVLSFFLLGIGLIVSGGCSKRFPNQPLEDQPPKTFLALMPDSTLNRSVSVQHVHWWGVDPDGFVIGYYFSLDSLHWTFTTKSDSIFVMHLSTNDTTYSFFVAAVDNEHVVDPHPASLRYPIENTPPVAAFLLNSNPPDTTYTVATFQWTGTDVDGDETIVSYYYALDDTSNPANWKSLPGTSNLVTLFKSDGLTEGDHVFYLKAQDIAGAYSPIIRMPDTSHVWHVREPRGDFLIVRDYSSGDSYSRSFYEAMFDTLMGGRLGTKDIFDLKQGATAISRGEFVPPLINPTFTETLKLFKYVYWYSDNAPSLDIAQASLPGFKSAGGKVLMTAGFPQYPSTQGGVGNFAPIDGIEGSYFTTILQSRDTMAAVDPTYPTLIRDTLGFIYTFPRGILPKVDARILYEMQPSDRWSGQPVMGVKDADQASFVLIAGILHRFGTPPDRVSILLRRVYQGEFGVQ
ncbi:MAG TPA: hypothetical protein VMM57_02720 [Bacteroidota bacterium]|nr:hypothetical protein [Bacteroidota bacterium]